MRLFHIFYLLRRKLFFIPLGVIVLSVSIFTVAHAYPPGGVFGRAEFHGYFTNQVSYYGQNILPQIGNGQALPSVGPNSVNSVQEFLRVLKNANASGDNLRTTGSAFIVYTMLGRNGANYSRIVSNADWQDLRNRLNDRAANGKIAWQGDVVNCTNSFWQNDNDAGYYDECKNEPGIRFYNDNGTLAYELLRRCANPMGDVSGLPNKPPDKPKPPVNPGPGSGNAYGCKPMLVKVYPGRDARGQYVPVNVRTIVRNLGTYSAPATINITSDHTTGTTYTVYFQETTWWVSNYTPVKDPNNGAIIRWDPVYSPPRSWTDSIGPCYDYSLTPLVDLNGQTTIESGGTGRINNSVINGADASVQYGPTKSPAVDWRLTRMIFQPNTTLSGGDTSARTTNSDPCGAFSGAGRTACDVVQEDPSRVFPVGTSTFTPIYNYIAATNLATGTQVCFTVGVSRPTEDPTPVWRHSALRCFIVSKKPKFQVHGGDVRVGGNIETGLSTVTSGTSTKTYGSWVEYGALAVGSSNGFASGSGLNNGGVPAPSAWNNLTFANIDNNGTPSYGYYAFPPRLASLIAQFTGSTPLGTANSNVGSMSSGTYSATNLTIGATSIGQDAGGRGKSIIIVASGTVTINGDITYTGAGGSGTFTNLSQIPQLVIVANAINITGATKNIDAWLMTTGAMGGVNTCSDAGTTAALTSDICSNVLHINGPVVTNHLYLRRTAGADDGDRSGDPAEVFNLRADAYTWARAQSSDAGKAQTVYTSELPPRF
jgi:hypothetical protein